MNFINDFSKADKILFKAAILAILLFAIFSLSSCGSKKKQLEKTKSEIEIKRKLDSVNTSKVFTEKKKVEEATSSETEKEEIIEYNGKAGDSLKVIKIGETGKILSATIYTGTGKAIINNKRKTTQTKNTNSEASKKTADSNVSVNLEETKKESAKILKKDNKTTGPSFSFYVWLTAIIAIVAGGWWLNRKFSLIAKIRNLI